MKNFEPGRVYTANLPIFAGDINMTDVCIADARIMGCLAQHIVLKMFGNIYSLPGKEAPGDVIETHPDGFRVWEVKTTRRSTVNIQPSREKGSGRTHDPERFARYLKSIHGVIVVDQRQLPTVSFCGISVSEIQARFGPAPKNFRTDHIYTYVIA